MLLDNEWNSKNRAIYNFQNCHHFQDQFRGRDRGERGMGIIINRERGRRLFTHDYEKRTGLMMLSGKKDQSTQIVRIQSSKRRRKQGWKSINRAQINRGKWGVRTQSYCSNEISLYQRGGGGGGGRWERKLTWVEILLGTISETAI